MRCIHVLCLLSLFTWSSLTYAEGAPSIQCADDDFDCYVLEPGEVVLRESDPTQILYKGKVFSLKLTSKKIVRRTDPIAELPGHTVERQYLGEGIVVTVTEKIRETSCWEKSGSGAWEESQSCCGGESNVTVLVVVASKRTILTGTKHFGL